MTTFFDTPTAFRAWLKKHHTKAVDIEVGFRSVENGHACITWPEAVDEALCFGWIDGARRNIDATTYRIRFSPRKLTSTWSARNIERATALMAEGKMTKPGLAAFEARKPTKTKTYSYEQDTAPELTPAMLRALQTHGTAWITFQKMPPSHRRKWAWWIVSAKQDATRTRRFEKMLTDLNR
jgi:uncharacterized protein YdeI (YjbR/CyaY-like superfamily)